MPYILPSEFQFTHNFCFFLHDHLLHILNKFEEDDFHSFQFELKENKIPENLEGEELVQ